MITMSGIHKAFGQQVILRDASLQINDRDRLCLVGPNGSGKSTLFKILLGREETDAGRLIQKRGAAVGYLPQENAPVGDGTVLSETLAETGCPDGRVTAKAKAVLMGLGFKATEFEKPMNALSGGWAMRVAMARLLISEPDLLLLDEPTNHLDIDSLFWLQGCLQGYPGAVFLISHERRFINAVCRSIVHLHGQDLRVYHGDYEFFLREREVEDQRIWSAWKLQQDEIARMQDFIDRNRARVSTANRAQSMIKRLAKVERIIPPEDAKTLKIRFPQPCRTGVRVLQLKKVCKSYGAQKVYEDLDFELDRGWKVAFVGHNGAGKSTLLKLLGGIIPVDSGEMVLGFDVKVGYFSQHREGNLNPERTVLEEASNTGRLNTELFIRTVLGTFLFPGDSVFKKVGVLSGGEKSRLALVKFLLDPPNVLLLDEPTTHLDMASVDALADALRDFEGTICCISHDLHFINSLADHVVHIDHGTVLWYPGNYEYFKRRQAQWHEENPEAVSVEEVVKKEPPPDPGKEKKRAARRRFKLESELDKLESSLHDLAAQLSDPAIYADFAKVRRIGDEMEKVQEAIQTKTAELEKDA